jgi:hypothetical protein
VHDNPNWGNCEALTMEKIIDLRTEWYDDGLFVHFDDWIDELKEKRMSIFGNDFSNQININCHVPVLSYSFRYTSFSN